MYLVISTLLILHFVMLARKLDERSKKQCRTCFDAAHVLLKYEHVEVLFVDWSVRVTLII